MKVTTRYDKEIKNNIVTVDGVEYLPEKYNDFKKGDLVWNPFCFSDPVRIVVGNALTIADYNKTLDCLKLRRRTIVGLRVTEYVQAEEKRVLKLINENNY